MKESRKDVLQPVGDDVRRLAKALLRGARHAALATIDQVDGAPFASRVALATGMNGEPVFLISGLSGHFGNLEQDQRCSLLVGEPGKGDPLAHPRMTLVGTAERLAASAERDRVRGRYLMRHPKSALYVDFPDFAFWRVKLLRASLNGGFGKAYALAPEDLVVDMAPAEDLAASEASAVGHMNEDHADTVARYATAIGRGPGRWVLACVDPEGLDLVCGDETARIWFEQPVTSASALHKTLVAMAGRA
ncbi:MAG: HugZ family protein [Hyphomicrobiaceae bacterium]